MALLQSVAIFQAQNVELSLVQETPWGVHLFFSELDYSFFFHISVVPM